MPYKDPLYQKKYYEANKAEHNAYTKAYYEANKEKAKPSMKVYYEANKENLKDIAKNYRETHKEEMKAYMKAYHKANPEKFRAAANHRRAKKAGTISVPIRAKFKEYLIEIWDNKCAYCNNPSDRWEQDHFMPLELNGHHAEYNLVLACIKCNRSKKAKHPFMFIEEQKIDFIFKPYMKFDY